AVAHADEHALAVQGLLEEIARPELDGRDGVVDRGVAADHHHGDVPGGLVQAQLLEGLEPAHARQLEVEEDEIDPGLRLREQPERVLGGAGLQHPVSLAREHQLEGAPNVALVVDDQDRRREGFEGIGRARRARSGGRVFQGAVFQGAVFQGAGKVGEERGGADRERYSEGSLASAPIRFWATGSPSRARKRRAGTVNGDSEYRFSTAWRARRARSSSPRFRWISASRTRASGSSPVSWKLERAYSVRAAAASNSPRPR